jgi:hypothetical protein
MIGEELKDAARHLAFRLERLSNRNVTAGVFLVATVVLGGCSSIHWPTKLKLTAIIEVNGREYKGASVQEYWCAKGGGILRSLSVRNCFVKGEAVTVDLGDGRFIFIPFYGRRDLTGTFYQYMRLRPSALSRHWEIPSDQVPAIIFFKNINDPASAANLSPQLLKVTLGRGVRFKKFSVEYSTEALTRGRVQAAIPWIVKLDKTLGGNNVILPGAGVLNYDKSSFLGAK